jgi:hypothetical protein
LRAALQLHRDRVVRNRVCLASLVFVAACATGEDDVWTPPISGGGKADGVQLISGADIPSPHVDPNKRYIASRLVDPLYAVGAIDQGGLSVAWQSDGLVTPKNSRIDVAELVRCEQTESCNRFAEKGLVQLWRALEAPDGPVMRIDGLPSTTIETRVSPSEAVAIVPSLGTSTAVAHIGGIALDCRSTIALTETRVMATTPASDPSFNDGWVGSLTLFSDVSIALQVDRKDTVIFLSLDHAGYESKVSGPDRRLPSMMSGATIVERYRDGVRQESYAVFMPHVATGAKISASPYLDYTITTAAGPLAKNVESATLEHEMYRVEFTYAATPVPSTAADQAALDAVATPLSLAPGHYVVPIAGLGTFDFDVYSTGLILWRGQPSMWWLAPRSLTKTLSQHEDDISLEFVPATKELRGRVYGTTSPGPIKTGSVVVTPAMRI